MPPKKAAQGPQEAENDKICGGAPAVRKEAEDAAASVKSAQGAFRLRRLTEKTGNIAKQGGKNEQEVRDNEDRVNETRHKSGHQKRPGKISQSETERVADAT